ncbi:Light-sensor Protein kinase [Rhizophlyctis rosea]|nr:Light-sensor Protein kinase [Rhizophlyctis rosea]
MADGDMPPSSAPLTANTGTTTGQSASSNPKSSPPSTRSSANRPSRSAEYVFPLRSTFDNSSNGLIRNTSLPSIQAALDSVSPERGSTLPRVHHPTTTRFTTAIDPDTLAVNVRTSKDNLVSCADEPIHIPGAVQSYGALLAIEQGSYRVVQASENCAAVLGLSPAALFDMSSFVDCLNKEDTKQFRRQIRVVENAEPGLAVEVFIVRIQGAVPVGSSEGGVEGRGLDVEGKNENTQTKCSVSGVTQAPSRQSSDASMFGGDDEGGFRHTNGEKVLPYAPRSDSMESHDKSGMMPPPADGSDIRSDSESGSLSSFSTTNSPTNPSPLSDLRSVSKLMRRRLSTSRQNGRKLHCAAHKPPPSTTLAKFVPSETGTEATVTIPTNLAPLLILEFEPIVAIERKTIASSSSRSRSLPSFNGETIPVPDRPTPIRRSTSRTSTDRRTLSSEDNSSDTGKSSGSNDNGSPTGSPHGSGNGSKSSSPSSQTSAPPLETSKGLDGLFASLSVNESRKSHLTDISEDPRQTRHDIDEDEIIKSFTPKHIPLRLPTASTTVFSNSMDMFNLLNQITNQLDAQQDLQSLSECVVGIVKQVTGFHRVMMYQFDEEWNGNVVAEIVDPRYSRQIYRGLHFPASDIPPQAREMYRLSKVRMLSDRDSRTARMVCRSEEEKYRAVDMTFAYLRAMSPIHLVYLKNMGVRSSLSISVLHSPHVGTTAAGSGSGSGTGTGTGMGTGATTTTTNTPAGTLGRPRAPSNAGGGVSAAAVASGLGADPVATSGTQASGAQLWGLISCHGYTPHLTPFPLRNFLRLLGDVVGRGIERLLYKDKTEKRRSVMQRAGDMGRIGEWVLKGGDEVVSLVNADFALLSIMDESKILGETSTAESREILAMLHYLRSKGWTSIVQTRQVEVDFEDFKRWWNEDDVGSDEGISGDGSGGEENSKRPPKRLRGIAGVLYIPLSVGGKDFLAFFRREEVVKRSWAGNPHTAHPSPQRSYALLTPRASFGVWQENIRGKSTPWTEDEVEISLVLQLVYWKFIGVWREKETLAKLRAEERRKGRVSAGSDEIAAVLAGVGGDNEDVIGEGKRKGVSLANVSDEVRTPLNAIISYLETAMNQTLDSDLRAYLARSHQASKSLVYMINDLLDLTKVEAGKMLTRRDPFDVRNALNDAVKMFVVDAEKKGVEFGVFFEVVKEGGEMEGTEIPKSVLGDVGRFKQIIINLCNNALKFTDTGHVHVSSKVASRRDSTVIIEVMIEDTGAGIPEEKLNVIFEDLEQLQRSGPRDAGTGLGLAVVARIIHNMEGQLRVESREGHGSKFTFSIPFELAEDGYDSPNVYASNNALLVDSSASRRGSDVQAEASTLGAVQKQLAPREVKDVLNVLVAEDDLMNQKIMQKRLAKDGHKVTIANNGKECFDHFVAQQGYFDVILMDLQMPLCDGPTATEQIRAHELAQLQADPPKLYHPIPIIACSANAYSEDRSNCRRVGMQGFMSKPINFGMLKEMLAAIGRGDRCGALTGEDEVTTLMEDGWFKKG